MDKKKRIFGFAALIIAEFLGTLDSSIVNIALPNITDYFKASLNDTSWISTIYVLALSVFMITASKLADQFGRKKLMIIGLVTFGASSVLCSFAPSLIFLIIIRFLQGIGGAIITPIVLPMGFEMFDKEKRQMVIGAAGAVVALAVASGPPIGGLLIKYMNWRAVFFVNIPFCIISLILTILFVNESYDNTVSKEIDWIGMILLTACLFCFTFSLLKGKDYGWHSMIIVSLFAVSAVSFALFIFAEHKSKAPMIELGLFREVTFTTSSLCYMIVGFAIMSPMLIFNFFLQNVLEYSVLNAAFILMSVSLSCMISVPTGSVLAKKIGVRIINFLGILIVGIGVFLLTKVNVNTAKAVMIFDLFVCGLGMGFSCQTLASSVKHLPDEKSGIGSGIINAFRQIGSCIGIAVMVSMLNTNVSNAKNNIKKDAVSYINNDSCVVQPVKNTLINIVNSLNGDSIKISKSSQKKVENTLINNKPLLSKNSNIKDGLIKKLYDNTGLLCDGAYTLSSGQSALNQGITFAGSGIGTLSDKSKMLSNGLGKLNSGLTQVNSGVQELNTKISSKDEGTSALQGGIQSLNMGAEKLLSEFSSGNSQDPTLYDGIENLKNGSKSLSSGVDNYVSAVDSTFYTLIKSNPKSPDMLNIYKGSLMQAEALYKKTPNEQYKTKIQMLSNLISIYTAAEDPSVTNASQFESKLLSLGTNVVSSGSTLKSGAENLSDGTSKAASQFEDGGTFKEGVKALSDGTEKLSEKSSELQTLNDSIEKLAQVTSALSDNSTRLYDGSVKLGAGLMQAEDGSKKVSDGSLKLVNGSNTLSDDLNEAAEEIGALGQKKAIQNVVTKIDNDKNDKVTDAFSSIFLLTAIVTCAAAVLGLFTDRK